MEKTVTESSRDKFRRIHFSVVKMLFCIGTVILSPFAGSETLFIPLDGTVPYSETSGTFSRVPIPGPGDWLTENNEEGQTYEQFLVSPRNRVEGKRTVIYLQPIWYGKKSNGPQLKYLRKFTEIYFFLPVKVQWTMHPSEKKFSIRINPYSYNPQVNADLLLGYLRERIPSRAYCVLGITMVDLYPDPLWNFVFGYATYEKRVGVFSFARYAPSFRDALAPPNPKLLFLRSCKILAHETGHMFGMAHCISYHCVMNGCNSLKENDAQPIHLCPVCLKKLQHATTFDIVKRYETLAVFYEAAGFYAEARWVRKRLENLDSSDSPLAAEEGNRDTLE